MEVGARFGSTYSNIGMIQRRSAEPLRKDDTHFGKRDWNPARLPKSRMWGNWGRACWVCCQSAPASSLGKPLWNWKRRRPSSSGRWAAAQWVHTCRRAYFPASLGTSVPLTFACHLHVSSGRSLRLEGQGSLWYSWEARGLSSLWKSQEQAAQHFFSDQDVPSWVEKGAVGVAGL